MIKRRDLEKEMEDLHEQESQLILADLRIWKDRKCFSSAAREEVKKRKIEITKILFKDKKNFLPK